MTIDIVDALRTLAPNCPDGEHTLLDAAELIVQMAEKLKIDDRQIRPADPSI
jgi:hypothetical protein